MNKFLSIGASGQARGVSTSTLRRWEVSGRLALATTEGGQRRYDFAALLPERFRGALTPRRTIAYAGVSSRDERADLARQREVLELYCASQGRRVDLIADCGSGINYHKKGWKRLRDAILVGDVGRLVPIAKDRLLRFGAELVFAVCEAKNVEVVIIKKGADTTFEEDLASNVLEIITVFPPGCKAAGAIKARSFSMACARP